MTQQRSVWLVGLHAGWVTMTDSTSTKTAKCSIVKNSNRLSPHDRKYKRWTHNVHLTIVVGGRGFNIAGGPPNMYVVVYIHRVYKWYLRYVYSIYGGPPAKTKSRKLRPPTSMHLTIIRTCLFLSDCVSPSQVCDSLPHIGRKRCTHSGCFMHTEAQHAPFVLQFALHSSPRMIRELLVLYLRPAGWRNTHYCQSQCFF